MAHDAIRVRSAAHQFYDGRQIVPGEIFETTESDAADLRALNFILPGDVVDDDEVDDDSGDDAAHRRNRKRGRK